MIHYHGTPISGSRQDTARFLVGRHALVSYYRPDDLGAVLEFCQSFCLDNGAFSHWKSGKGRIDFDKYFAWVNNIYKHPSFDWALIPDKIDGTEQENLDWVLKWIRTGTKAKGVPIWHLHESLDYLEWLVDNFDTIAFGSSGMYKQPGTSTWWYRIDEAMTVACYSNGSPKCKLHGLRLLNPTIFSKLPLSSADSTNAGINCSSLDRFGLYKPATSSQRAAVIADRIESNNSASFYMFGEL